MVVLEGGADSYGRGTPALADRFVRVAVERTWHMQDRQVQIMALKSRPWPLLSDAVLQAITAREMLVYG